MNKLPEPYYQDDLCTLYCGDCRDIIPLLNKVDLILTDPPYVFKNGVGGGGFASNHKYSEKMLEPFSSFDLSLYVEYLKNISDVIICFHSRDQILEYAKFFTEEFGGYDLHFWYKSNAIPFTNNTWKSDVEYIALGWRGKVKHKKVP